MRSTSIVAVTVAAALIFAPTFIFPSFKNVKDPLDTDGLFNEILWRCDDSIGEKYCRYLLSPIRQFVLTDFPDLIEDTSYQIRRSAIPQTELPVLRIYMTDGALGKLRKKREITLNERIPMLFTGDDDWVRATIVVDDGKNQNQSKVMLRLKGDMQDHWDKPKKLSFRIKVQENGLAFGMSKFSIQRPATRNYQYEALVLAMARRLGLLAPRYFFVDVQVNGDSWGVMALEEHFTKEMVESQNRREGPMLALDDDWQWRQSFICNSQSIFCKASDTNVGFVDYPVKVFRSGSFNPETVHRRYVIEAMSLLRDKMDGRIRGDRVFDLDLVSLWWVMVGTWKAEHSIGMSNLRFYFNAISGRLEPVPFDNEPTPRRRSRQVTAPAPEEFPKSFTVESLLHSSTFRELTRKNIKKIGELLDSESFQDWFTSEHNRYLRILWLDGTSPDDVLIGDLRKNLVEMSRYVSVLFASADGSTEYRSMTEDRDNDPIHGRRVMESGVPLYSHLRPFWFWSEEGTDIEIKNLTLHPVTIHSVFFGENPGTGLVPAETTVPVYQEGSTDHVFRSKIDLSGLDISDQMQIRYSYRGQEYTRPVFLQFRNYKSGYESKEIARVWFDQNGVLLDQATKTITFPSGRYSLTTNFETEKDWGVVLLPGAVLEFKQGARLKVNGPVHALGTKELPVKFVIESDPNLGLLGSWGGLLILEANRESILRHTHITGAATDGFSERQDSYGLTGCVTFYKSNVRIEHSRFSGLQCEDALNIISADFNIDYVEFVDSSADALDSDFSTGTVTNSTFRNIVNDGIDVSGSRVQVSSSRFSYIRDKAISVGEDSTFDATELTIDHASAGVVSKDKSVVNIRNSFFKDVNNALMAYVKKEEWGPAEIHCDNCLFDHVESVSVEQYASRIIVDGEEVSPTPFSRKQLQIAGYIQ